MRQNPREPPRAHRSKNFPRAMHHQGDPPAWPAPSPPPCCACPPAPASLLLPRRPPAAGAATHNGGAGEKQGEHGASRLAPLAPSPRLPCAPRPSDPPPPPQPPTPTHVCHAAQRVHAKRAHRQLGVQNLDLGQQLQLLLLKPRILCRQGGTQAGREGGAERGREGGTVACLGRPRLACEQRSTRLRLCLQLQLFPLNRATSQSGSKPA